MGINMNNLFENGDYVLLEDCKSFDEKFGLEEGATMWAVARKMEGGEPNPQHMSLYRKVSKPIEKIGIIFGMVGAWAVSKELTTKLSVEDVLYRSKDGLTLDELSKIHGAFEDGKRYECVVGNGSLFMPGTVYTANDRGLSDEHSYTERGMISKFKPVTKAEWVPSVGDEVIFEQQKCFVEHYKDGLAWVTKGKSSDLVNICFLKPTDQERERIVDLAMEYFNGMSVTSDSAKPLEIAYKLYDAGMLKEGDK